MTKTTQKWFSATVDAPKHGGWSETIEGWTDVLEFAGWTEKVANEIIASEQADEDFEVEVTDEWMVDGEMPRHIHDDREWDTANNYGNYNISYRLVGIAKAIGYEDTKYVALYRAS